MGAGSAADSSGQLFSNGSQSDFHMEPVTQAPSGSPRLAAPVDPRFRRSLLVFVALVTTGFAGMALFFHAAPAIDGFAPQPLHLPPRLLSEVLLRLGHASVRAAFCSHLQFQHSVCFI